MGYEDGRQKYSHRANPSLGIDPLRVNPYLTNERNPLVLSGFDAAPALRMHAARTLVQTTMAGGLGLMNKTKQFSGQLSVAGHPPEKFTADISHAQIDQSLARIIVDQIRAAKNTIAQLTLSNREETSEGRSQLKRSQAQLAGLEGQLTRLCIPAISIVYEADPLSNARQVTGPVAAAAISASSTLTSTDKRPAHQQQLRKAVAATTLATALTLSACSTQKGPVLPPTPVITSTPEYQATIAPTTAEKPTASLEVFGIFDAKQTENQGLYSQAITTLSQRLRRVFIADPSFIFHDETSGKTIEYAYTQIQNPDRTPTNLAIISWIDNQKQPQATLAMAIVETTTTKQQVIELVELKSNIVNKLMDSGKASIDINEDFGASLFSIKLKPGSNSQTFLPQIMNSYLLLAAATTPGEISQAGQEINKILLENAESITFSMPNNNSPGKAVELAHLPQDVLLAIGNVIANFGANTASAATISQDQVTIPTPVLPEVTVTLTPILSTPTVVPTIAPSVTAVPTEVPTATPQPEILLKSNALQIYTTADQRSTNQSVTDAKNVKVTGTVGDYYQVQLDNGQSGFVLKSQVEIANTTALSTVSPEKLAWMNVPFKPSEVITADEFQITADISGQGRQSLLDVVFQSSTNINDWSGRQFLRLFFENDKNVAMNLFDGTQPGPEWHSNVGTHFNRPNGPISVRILNDSTQEKMAIVYDQSGNIIARLSLPGAKSPKGAKLVQNNITISPDSFALQVPPLTTELPIVPVLQNGINLRQLPGTQTPIVGKLSSSDSLLVLGKNTAENWIRVAVVGKDGKQAQEGWVAASLLTNVQTENLPKISSPPVIAAPKPVQQQTNPIEKQPDKSTSIQLKQPSPEQLAGKLVLQEKIDTGGSNWRGIVKKYFPGAPISEGPDRDIVSERMAATIRGIEIDTNNRVVVTFSFQDQTIRGIFIADPRTNATITEHIYTPDFRIGLQPTEVWDGAVAIVYLTPGSGAKIASGQFVDILGLGW